jgi:hypothetical protein
MREKKWLTAQYAPDNPDWYKVATDAEGRVWFSEPYEPGPGRRPKCVVCGHGVDLWLLYWFQPDACLYVHEQCVECH